MLQLALVRLIEIVGEAACRVPESVRQQYPGLPWRHAIGMRHVLAHRYDIIEYQVIHDTLRHDLPQLIDRLVQVLADDHV